MSLHDLTDVTAVKAAVTEYDYLGRDAFLHKYGFHKALRYYLHLEGRTYDSKAIVGAAHGYQFPDAGPLAPSEFSGGLDGAVAKLEELGFEVGPESPTGRFVSG